MRSEVIYRAAKNVKSRYALCGVCAKGTRELHIPSGRVEDTINLVLLILGRDSEDNSVSVTRNLPGPSRLSESYELYVSAEDLPVGTFGRTF